MKCRKGPIWTHSSKTHPNWTWHLCVVLIFDSCLKVSHRAPYSISNGQVSTQQVYRQSGKGVRGLNISSAGLDLLARHVVVLVPCLRVIPPHASVLTFDCFMVLIRSNFRPLCFYVKNRETFSILTPKKAAKLTGQSRELLQKPHMHWVSCYPNTHTFVIESN